MSEFSDAELAIGSIRGRRQWRVSVDGRLSGLSYNPKPWGPGENIAVCQAYPGKEQVEPKRDDEPDSKRFYADQERWRRNHDMLGCQHGFYAYFGDNSDWQYGEDPRLSGIIEGYGETVIGTKGFRCMKARILAIALEPAQGIWNLDEFVQRKIRANYPGIEFFDSALAMEFKFPATRADELANEAVAA